VAGDGARISGPLADGPKNVEINCRFQSCCALMRLEHLEDDSWG
jgi:hypothetical protein